MSTPHPSAEKAGSSSIKYQVIDADDEAVLASGIIQRIGETRPARIDPHC